MMRHSSKGSSKQHVDRRLLPRIRQCLPSTAWSLRDRSRFVNDVVDALVKQYPEYQRKKKAAFTSIVAQALKELEVDDNDVHNRDAAGASGESSFSSDNEAYVAYQDTNMVNTSILSLYKKSTPKLADNSGCTSPFFIDKTPSSTQLAGSEFSQRKRKKKQDEDDRQAKATKLSFEASLQGKKAVDANTRAVDIDGMSVLSLVHETLGGTMFHTSGFPIVRPATTFADVGGCEQQLLDICRMLLHLKHPEIFRQLGVTPPRGFLLHGPPGCGKSLVVDAISGEFGFPLIKVAATELVSGVSGESEQKLRQLFERAMNSAPCLLFIDEIDAITPKRETAQREMERRIVSQLLSCIDDLAAKPECNVMLIGATCRPDALEPALRRAGRFDKEISLGIPDEAARKKILEVVCRDLTLPNEFNFGLMARLTPGYVGADLCALAREASLCAIERIFKQLQALLGDVADCKQSLLVASRNLVVTWLKETSSLPANELEVLHIEMQDFESALKLIQPSAKREGFTTVPDVTWDDIGALSAVREELKWSILYPIRCPEDFVAMGLVSRPQGILLCGPPGCGKTMLAKAIANESGMNFISVKGPELLSMFVGESERAVRQVFQRARSSAPCVIFFDELDALCPRRHDSDSGSSVRVVNQLLTEMDGLESRKQVFLIGATNRPDIIDPAILRPGRLDKIVYVGFPGPHDRTEILRALTKNGTQPRFSPDVDFEVVGRDPRIEWFTGADLAALVREASVAALKQRVQMQAISTEMCLVTREHMELAFAKVHSSVSEKERLRFEALRLVYGQ